MRVPLIYREAPEFGFDLGTHTVKVVQLRKDGRRTVVQGYGYCDFPGEAVADGVVVKPEEMAKAVKPLLEKVTNGKITARRVVTSVPSAKLFTRTLQLPIMDEADLNQAIHFEVEQYVPIPLAELYLDYEIVSKTEGEKGHMDVLMMAAPKSIIDSYLKLFDLLGLEISAIEADMAAVVRALLHSGDAGGSTLLMNIGSVTSDLTIYDKFIPLTGTVPVGGEQYTNSLVTKLGIKADEAKDIKFKFGIGPSGMYDKVFPALEQDLQTAIKEAKRVVKFYESRSQDQKLHVDSMVISGGTAQMPGIADYFQKEIGLPLKVANPWKNLQLKKSFSDPKEAPMYATAIGLALRGLE